MVRCDQQGCSGRLHPLKRRRVSNAWPSIGDPVILALVEDGLAQLRQPCGLIIEVTETAAESSAAAAASTRRSAGDAPPGR